MNKPLEYAKFLRRRGVTVNQAFRRANFGNGTLNADDLSEIASEKVDPQWKEKTRRARGAERMKQWWSWTISVPALAIPILRDSGKSERQRELRERRREVDKRELAKKALEEAQKASLYDQVV